MYAPAVSLLHLTHHPEATEWKEITEKRVQNGPEEGSSQAHGWQLVEKLSVHNFPPIH